MPKALVYLKLSGIIKLLFLFDHDNQTINPFICSRSFATLSQSLRCGEEYYKRSERIARTLIS